MRKGEKRNSAVPTGSKGSPNERMGIRSITLRPYGVLNVVVPKDHSNLIARLDRLFDEGMTPCNCLNKAITLHRTAHVKSQYNRTAVTRAQPLEIRTDWKLGHTIRTESSTRPSSGHRSCTLLPVPDQSANKLLLAYNLFIVEDTVDERLD